MSKYGVFSGPYFPVFGPEKTPYMDTFHAVERALRRFFNDQNLLSEELLEKDNSFAVHEFHIQSLFIDDLFIRSHHSYNIRSKPNFVVPGVHGVSNCQNSIQYSSVIRQKGESQNGCFKKTKHAKFPEKRTFLTP